MGEGVRNDIIAVAKIGGEHWNNDTIRQIEHESIRRFVRECGEDGYLSGRTLDFGCGTSPYREYVTGDYVGYDRVKFPGNVSLQDVGTFNPFSETFDAILCNQVLQYCGNVEELLGAFYALLEDRRGNLVLTIGTNWAEVEPDDLHRHTKAGIERLLKASGFSIERSYRRAEINVGGFCLALGYAIVASA